MRIVMLGPFGLAPKATMLRRALPAARALARRGHVVTLIMPPWHTPEAAGRAWDDDVPGVRLVYVDLAGLAVPGVGHAAVALRMARQAMALAPDVVHAFKPKAYAGLADAVLHAARRLRGWSRTPASAEAAARRPALVVDTDDWEGPGGWNALEPYSPAERWVFARQERWGLGHADAVTVASRALETLVWSLGVPPARVTYLPNAIDATRRSPAADAAPAAADVMLPTLDAAPVTADTLDRRPTILLYTRFFEFDLERPLDVLARVRRDRPGVRLVVAGRGLFGEERRFLEIARASGLAGAVEDRGWVDPADLPAVLAGADVAIYPFDDTLVNRTKSAFKLLELMAAGVPVVAEAVGQNREVIHDGVSGRLVPPGDVAAFAGAVGGLLDDAAARAAMGRAACARVAREYSWERQAADLEAAYRRASGAA